ncbi:hypothetical protein AWZ03_003622 [Drosophila navojoa]|uniref:Uncharacterized protein n=1 Tax=Drosophila navojoa TaxID=7232 RepID=A0A484BPG9_DRONA|nr:hypothetical protein AWZ03_003622 [Drosophila navojoa]
MHTKRRTMQELELELVQESVQELELELEPELKLGIVRQLPYQSHVPKRDGQLSSSVYLGLELRLAGSLAACCSLPGVGSTQNMNEL